MVLMGSYVLPLVAALAVSQATPLRLYARDGDVSGDDVSMDVTDATDEAFGQAMVNNDFTIPIAPNKGIGSGGSIKQSSKLSL